MFFLYTARLCKYFHSYPASPAAPLFHPTKPRGTTDPER